MEDIPSARRPVLVTWIYNDGSNAFIECVLATPEEEERLRRRLFKLTDPSVDSRTRRGAIYDLYVGPKNAPTPFADFWRELDLNPYIAEHEKRTRQPAA